MTILSLWVGSQNFWIVNTDDPIQTKPKKGVEIELVWRRPLRISRWFFLNRYFAFFGNVAVLVISFVHLSSAVRFSIFSLAL